MTATSITYTVAPHGRRDVAVPMWRVEIRLTNSSRPITLYVTARECADYGIVLPRHGLVAL